ncbi:MAG: HipA domain-containing protein [Clostridia bacterium]
MECFLMHKDITVLKMEIDEITGSIVKILEVINQKHIPMGVHFDRDILDRKTLNSWLNGRSIPASRDNIENALETLDEDNTGVLISKCLGLSLSDCYWICPVNTSLKYENINFFENDFSKDMGEILFGKQLDSFSLMSPDNTSDGWLKKKWIIKNNKRYLVKGSSGVYRQEPFNELIASTVCEKLNIPYVKYELEFIDDMPYSICENFLSKDTELVSAWSIYSHFKKPNNISIYEHLIDCLEKVGVKNAKEKIDRMLILDFIIANTDRHMNNFGVIRNSNTCEILDFAPIYDSGTSMFMTNPSHLEITDIESKPFAKLHSQQIKLINKKVDVISLKTISDDILKILDQNKFLDKARKDFIIENFKKRVKNLI